MKHIKAHNVGFMADRWKLKLIKENTEYSPLTSLDFAKFLRERYKDKVKFITIKQKHIDEFIQNNPNLSPETLRMINLKVGRKYSDCFGPATPVSTPRRYEEPEFGDAPGDDDYRSARKMNRNGTHYNDLSYYRNSYRR